MQDKFFILVTILIKYVPNILMSFCYMLLYL